MFKLEQKQDVVLLYKQGRCRGNDLFIKKNLR